MQLATEYFGNRVDVVICPSTLCNVQVLLLKDKCSPAFVLSVHQTVDSIVGALGLCEADLPNIARPKEYSYMLKDRLGQVLEARPSGVPSCYQRRLGPLSLCAALGMRDPMGIGIVDGARFLRS